RHFPWSVSGRGYEIIAERFSEAIALCPGFSIPARANKRQVNHFRFAPAASTAARASRLKYGALKNTMGALKGQRSNPGIVTGALMLLHRMKPGKAWDRA